jgi:ElaA protein
VSSEPAPIRRAAFTELDGHTLYRILRLRQEVFAVEQDCAYLDLDGRDVEPATVHVWIDEQPEGPAVSACLRLLADPDGATQIGRIVTASAARHRGLGRRLMTYALETTDPPWVLKAQSRLTDWYGAFGFRAAGPEFMEDGIPHTPMRRA